MRKRRTDGETIRKALVGAAETMLQETGGRRLVMSELAARVGLTQSHAHNFFATKNDLVRSLAGHWFEEVEKALQSVVTRRDPPAAKLRRYVLTSLRMKRARFDQNPALFRAYLALAADHPDLVAKHAKRLRDLLEQIVSELVPPRKVKSATEMIHDATVLFRIPHNIALFRPWVTDKRAEAVVTALLAAITTISSNTA